MDTYTKTGMDTYTKTEDGKLQKTSTEERVEIYDYQFLLDQKTGIETKLAEVNNLIAEADKLKITTKEII